MKRIGYIFAALALLPACQEEKPLAESASPRELYASLVEETRTYVDGTGDQVRMHWTAGDAVTAFFSSYGEQYVFQGQTGDTGGRFEKVIESGFTSGFEISRNYAVYPYAAGMQMLNEGTVSMTVPATQQYAPDSFGLGAGIMAAVTASSEETHFVFKNATGYLKLQIYGGGTVKSIVFKGNAGEKIAGAATLKIPTNGTPVLEVTGDGTEVTLNCGSVVTAQEKADATTFWFALPPMTFAQGFTVEVTDGNDLVTTKKLTRSFEIQRNIITPMTPFELAGQAPEPPAPEIPDLPDWPYEGSRLPVLYVYTPDNVAVTTKENWVAESHAYLREADGTAEGKITDLGTANIRLRGNSTLAYPKKAYAFKLDKKASLLGMPSDKRWDLLANYIDRTRLRNHVALEMGRRLSGLAWTPKGQFVELFLNGEHMGNYYLVEHIKIAENRVNITEMKAGDTDLSGGYLLEMSSEMDEPYQFYTNYFDRWGQGQYRLPVMVKSPEDEDMDNTKLAWIQNFINSVQTNVLGGNAAWHDQVDMDSFVDWMLVQEITGNYEPFHPKSCYLHKDRGGKLMMGPLWDFDYGTFMNSGAGGNSSSTIVYHYSIWYGSMIQDAAFKAKVRERWPAIKAAFLAVADEIPTSTTEAARNNALGVTMDVAVSQDKDWVKWGGAASSPKYNKDEGLGIWQAYQRIKDNLVRRVNQFDQTEIPNNF